MASTLKPIVQELVDLINQNGWKEKFEEALKNAKAQNVVEFDSIKTLDDYFDWLNAQLSWVPVENRQGTIVYQHVAEFYFLLDQEPVKSLQNAVVPHDQQPALTVLSKWMQKYVDALGEWMDQPQSITKESVQTFFASPIYNMNEYIEPRGGWKTFNEMFARSTKPGCRPIADILDDTVITADADSTFDGQWEIRSDSFVTIKGLHWKIEELLDGSPYKDCFMGGQFTHSFLNTTDYHRQHAPVGGLVLESRMIQGCVYLQVEAEPIAGDPEGKQHIVIKRKFDIPDTPGYQFQQARGLVVIASSIGLVAVCPMGMAQVSSIITTAEVGRTLRKGEEISYFQFGGSDIVTVFQQQSNVTFTAQPGIHYKVGTQVAKAHPVMMPAPYIYPAVQFAQK
ncbi:MAG: phosphatidylserine decarboxylase [Bacteroidales bacterium]|nr:phosphatidylserine decarboxylase [Bacteroidales bacterium]MCD8386035.1 phosphatidylserine decarboxylase [Bacteroidales bacterium]